MQGVAVYIFFCIWGDTALSFRHSMKNRGIRPKFSSVRCRGVAEGAVAWVQNSDFAKAMSSSEQSP